MNKNLHVKLIVLMLIFTLTVVLNELKSQSFICGNSLVDARDGKSYTTIQIGSQCWMRQNLNVGTRINGVSNQINNSIIEKYCYNNDENNCNIYGGFYQWDEGMNYATTQGAQGICPTGWHIPTDADWNKLEIFLDPTVKTDSVAFGPNPRYLRGTDIETKIINGGSSGFDVLFAGYWAVNSSDFEYLSARAYFMTSTKWASDNSFKWEHQYLSDHTSALHAVGINGFGLSIRCLKNTICNLKSYNVTGGGAFCLGGSGVNVGLDNSENGLSYQLMLNGVNAGSPISGTGSALSFGNQTLAGTYTVEAIDTTTGCTAIMNGSAVVTVNPLPAVNAGNNQSICSGSSATIGAAAVAGNTYIWTSNPVGFTSVISNTTVSPTLTTTYTLTETITATGCQNTNSVVITVNALPGVVVPDISICPGSQGTLTANATGVTYLWQGGETTQSVIVTATGIYCVTVSDITNGCKNSACGNVSLSTSCPFNCGNLLYDSRDGQSYTTVQIGAQCWFKQNLNIGTRVNGGTTMTNNGIIEKYCYGNVASNCTSYGGLYQWNEAMGYTTTQGAQGICPTGWHVPTDLELKILEMTVGMPQCTTDSVEWRGKGFATKLAIGGSSGFDMLYSGGWYSQPQILSFKNLTTYGYIFSSTQADATKAWHRGVSTDYYLNFYEVARSASLLTNGLAIRCIKDYDCNLNLYNVTGSGVYCSNGGNGLNVGLDGSQSGVSYRLYKNGICMGVSVIGTGFPISFGIMPVGTYTVSAIDFSTGCGNDMNGSAVITVTNPPSVSVSNITICSGSQGTLTANATGVTYLWSDGETTQSIVVLAAGQYCVTVTDNTTGCQNTACGNVTLNPVPLANAGNNQSICSGSSATIGAAAVAGNTYIWTSNPVGFISTSANPTVIPAVTTTYILTETITATGCQNTNSVVVTVNALPAVVVPDITICQGSQGILTANATGVTYLWSDGETTQSIVVMAAGQYCVTVTDILTGCQAFACGNVIVNPIPTVTVPDIVIGSSGILTANATGVSYLWQGGQTTQSITVASAGKYCVTVTDLQTGCQSSACGNVTVNNSGFAISCPSMQEVCEGSNAVFNVSVISGTGPFSYQWWKRYYDKKTDNYYSTKMVGETNPVCIIPSVKNATEDGCRFYAIVTDNSGKSLTSCMAVLKVDMKELILKQPLRQCTVVGGTVTFSVVVINDPTSNYQWQENGVNIAGATNSTYTITNVTASMCNYTYRVTASNVCNSVTSSPALLSVCTPPVIIGSTPYLCYAKLTWNAICGAQQYEIEYWSNDNNHTSKVITGTSAIITPLSPNTKYYWKIRSLCNGAICESNWSAMQNFTTLTNSCVCCNAKLMNSAANEDVNIYPNPTTGLVNITLPSVDNESIIKIYNLAGQIIYNEKLPTTNYLQPTKQIDMSGFDKGLYFVKISNDNITKTVKLVLQ